MKLLKMNFKYVIIVMASVAVFSCSDGEDGMTGAIGPQGEQGIQGPQGPAGQDGEAQGVPGPQGPTGQDGADGNDGADGQDGNANIIASDWINSGFPSTTSNFSFFDIDDSRFDKTVIDSGVILVYGKEITVPNNDEFVHAIPYESFNERYSFNVTPNELNGLILTAGRIRFTARSVDNSQEVFSRFSEFRYVILPSITSTSKSSVDFNTMTYKEVMDRFGLDY